MKKGGKSGKNEKRSKGLIRASNECQGPLRQRFYNSANRFMTRFRDRTRLMNATWLSHLGASGATFCGSSVRFGDEERQDVKRAAQGTVVVPLVHLGAIRATGEDANAFLHNLFSNDVKKLGPNEAQLTSFNSPKGRMLASIILWREAGDYLLALSGDIHEAILKKLSMYVLRSKVRLMDDSGDSVLIGLAGPQAGAALEAAGLHIPGAPRTTASGVATVVRLDGARFLVSAPVSEAVALWDRFVAAGALPAGTAAWRWLDICQGLPTVTQPVQEEFVAQMLNFDLIGGVSFNKGCYPGQEIVARTHYLGKLKKRMYRVHTDAADWPPAGTDVFSQEFGSQSAGKGVLAAPAPAGGFDALVVLQTSSAESTDVHLGAVDGPLVSFLPLPYALA